MTISMPPRPVQPNPSLWVRLRAVVRGMATVLTVLVAAPAALASAVLGTPPGWARRLCQRIADRYRLGYHDAVEADVIDDQAGEEEEGR